MIHLPFWLLYFIPKEVLNISIRNFCVWHQDFFFHMTQTVVLVLTINLIIFDSFNLWIIFCFHYTILKMQTYVYLFLHLLYVYLDLSISMSIAISISKYYQANYMQKYEISLLILF